MNWNPSTRHRKLSISLTTKSAFPCGGNMRGVKFAISLPLFHLPIIDSSHQLLWIYAVILSQLWENPSLELFYLSVY